MKIIALDITSWGTVIEKSVWFVTYFFLDLAQTQDLGPAFILIKV